MMRADVSLRAEDVYLIERIISRPARVWEIVPVAGYPWSRRNGRFYLITRRQNWIIISLVQILNKKLDNF
jgi:hypothetical protein